MRRFIKSAVYIWHDFTKFLDLNCCSVFCPKFCVQSEEVPTCFLHRSHGACLTAGQGGGREWEKLEIVGVDWPGACCVVLEQGLVGVCLLVDIRHPSLGLIFKPVKTKTEKMCRFISCSKSTFGAFFFFPGVQLGP